MRKLNAFVDLDGPLLDVRPRHHGVYQQIVEGLGGKPLGAAAFWDAKRRRVRDRDILAMTGLSQHAQAYEEQKQELIESEPFLLRDRLQAGAAATLRWLREDHRVVLVTLRRHVERLRRQLARLELAPLLDDVLVGAEARAGGEGWHLKVDLVMGAGIACAPADVFIGDTETDVLAGQALGVRTVAVGNGIRQATLLAALNPTWVVPEVAALRPALAR